MDNYRDIIRAYHNAIIGSEGEVREYFISQMNQLIDKKLENGNQ